MCETILYMGLMTEILEYSPETLCTLGDLDMAHVL